MSKKIVLLVKIPFSYIKYMDKILSEDHLKELCYDFVKSRNDFIIQAIQNEIIDILEITEGRTISTKILEE